jgi:hypothetical protein
LSRPSGPRSKKVMSRPNPDWVPTHELLEIFLETQDAHPATRGQQLCIKAHTELCRRIQAPAYIQTPKVASVPVPSSSESSPSDSLESGTTNSSKKRYTKEELRARYNKICENPTNNSNLALDSIPMLGSYVKHGAVISADKLLGLLEEIFFAELLLLTSQGTGYYELTRANKDFVRGWLAAKGYSKYVL